jgi:hypothetical protein
MPDINAQGEPAKDGTNGTPGRDASVGRPGTDGSYSFFGGIPATDGGGGNDGPDGSNGGAGTAGGDGSSVMIDAAQYVAGVTLNCQGNAHVTPDIEDVTNMSLTFSHKRFATIQSSWLEPRKIREMTFVGTRRMIVYDDLQTLEKIRVYDARVERPPRPAAQSARLREMAAAAGQSAAGACHQLHPEYQLEA